MTVNRETLSRVFTSFIRAMGYITPQQTLELESLRYDPEEETAQIEGSVTEERIN